MQTALGLQTCELGINLGLSLAAVHEKVMVRQTNTG